MMAAIAADKRGNSVTLVEKNKPLGKKLRITGKGRCNLTNASSIENHISHCVTNGKFLYNVYHQFFVQDIIDFFTTRGVELKTERGNRIFPVSNQAADIVSCLENTIEKTTRIRIQQESIDSIQKMDNRFTLNTSKNQYFADQVILCTGGKSYPATGSTGDGYKFAKQLGHSIKAISPGLVPMNVKEIEICKQLQGLSLKNVKISIFQNKQKVYEDFGEMVFTHFGVSGPMILRASSYLTKPKGSRLTIDLKPALSEDQLDLRLQRIFADEPKKQFKNILKYLLPLKLIPVIHQLSGISEKKRNSELSKKERKKMIKLLKEFTLTLDSFRSIKEAIITRGGVSVKEINPKTLESKLVPGLFFAGEIIDVDARTGGYNLQIAFSTGYVAGTSAASR